MVNLVLSPNSITVKLNGKTIEVMKGVESFNSLQFNRKVRIYQNLSKESLLSEINLSRLYLNAWGEWVYFITLEEIMGDFDLMDRLESAGVRLAVCSSVS